MATKTVKLLLTNADIPLTYEQASRSTLTNDDAAPRMPGGFSGDRINTDYGLPQLIYAENVMPYAKGIYSVSYSLQTVAVSPAVLTCDQYIALRDINENIRAFIPAKGANYVYNTTTSAWVSTSSFVFTGSLVTRAYVEGRTFICYEKNRIIEYDVATSLFTTISLTFPPGVTIANVRGIGAASNYLLFFTDFDIYWSSPLNILNFNDIDQGAGNQTPIDIKGHITSVLPISGGFIIYTSRNAIGATFTNNAAAPFVFKEINNAGGVSSWEKVTPEADETGHYLFGTNGLQLVGLNKAVTIFPEVTDFLTGGQSESWNSTTKTVDRVTSAPAFATKLAFLAGRFLVISYGVGTTEFQYALIYDTSQKRWGKLKITHTDAFMYAYSAGSGAYTYNQLAGTYPDLSASDYAALGLFFLTVTPPKLGMAFLNSAGEIRILQPSFVQAGDAAVAIFGRIQNRHGKKTTMQTLDLDGLKDSPVPVVSLLGGVDGYVRDSTTPMVAQVTNGNYRKFNKRLTSQNFDIAIEGTFVISNALVEVTEHGSR